MFSAKIGPKNVKPLIYGGQKDSRKRDFQVGCRGKLVGLASMHDNYTVAYSPILFGVVEQLSVPQVVLQITKQRVALTPYVLPRSFSKCASFSGNYEVVRCSLTRMCAACRCRCGR